MKSIELKTRDPLHKRIVEAVRARKKLAEQEIAKRKTNWEASDEECMAYIPEKDADALRRTARDSGEPQYTTLQIPYSYALLMSAHTYWTSVFLSRTPVLQFAGRHGESEQNVQAIESLLDYQTQVGGHLPPYYVWLYDAGKYGIGVIGEYWEDEVITYSEIVEEPVTLLGMPLQGQTKKKKVIRQVAGYSGNKLFNVRPMDYLPDPRVPVGDPQKGEFVGRKVDIPVTTMMRRKLSGQYINVDEARKRAGSRGTDRDQFGGDGTHEIPDNNTLDTERALDSTASVPAVEMVIDLIPKDWELGSTEYPEKWVFTVADDSIVIEAHPLGLNHGRFPYSVIECEVEGYSVFKRSMLDIARPLNQVMEWLINTHYYHVRQTLNGQIIFDPSRIVAKDLLSNEPGKRIRIRPEAYGQDVRGMIHTLGPDAAVTQNHLGDVRGVMDMMQVALGVNDTVTGSVNPGGRKTATEIRTSTSSSVNRMKTIAEYFSAVGFAPLSQRLLQSTQQNYRAEKKFRIAGDAIANPEKFMNISPVDIAGAYDYTPVDGTMPIDRFAMVNMWANLMTQMKNYPQVGAEYNISEIFAWVAQLGGLKNIKQFKINAMAPGQLQAQVQQGNMIPMGGGNGGSGANPGGGIGGGDRNTPRVPGLTQVAGMGPAG